MRLPLPLGPSAPFNQRLPAEDGTLERELIRRIKECGCEVRKEWLGGKAGASCYIRGKQVVFIDPAAAAQDRVEFLGKFLAGLTSPSPVQQAEAPAGEFSGTSSGLAP